MCARKIRNESFIIDRFGNELPFGRFWGIHVCPNGWLMPIDEPPSETSRFHFIHREDGRMIDLPFREHRVYHCFGDLYAAHENDKSGANSFLWSVREQRSILSKGYKLILPLTAPSGHFLVKDAHDHLQIRADGDKLLEDLGKLPDKLIWMWEEDRPFYIPYKTYKDDRLRCVDLMTGKKFGPEFTCIGDLREGMRYMRTPDGKDYFVDKDWNILFELPYPAHLLDNVTDPDIQCRDGLISIESDNFCYLMDASGQVLIPPRKHRYLHNVGEKRLLISKGPNYALADATGAQLTDYLYRSGYFLHAHPYSFSEQRLHLVKKTDKKNEKVGFLDPDGNEVIPFIYDLAHGNFEQGIISVALQ